MCPVTVPFRILPAGDDTMDLATTKNYHHSPFKEPDKEVRLLTFTRTGGGEELECSLTQCLLESAPPYSALSYTWGSPKPAAYIWISGRRFRVQTNCHWALQQLRDIGTTMYYWIDSICINQQNLKEKSRQVQLMGQIYRRAKLVLVSLGPTLRDPDLLGETIKDGDTTYAAFAGHERSQTARLAESYATFIYARYWTRIWVIQEVTLAVEIRIMCGTFLLDVPAVLTFGEDFRQNVRHLKWHGEIRGAWEDRDHRRVKEYLTFTKQSTDKTGIINALERFRESQCSEVRDKIYGFREIADWGDSGPPDVDYEKPLFEVALDCMAYVRKTADCADISSAFRSTQKLLAVLGIGYRDADMEREVEQRREQSAVIQSGGPTIFRSERKGFKQYPIFSRQCFTLGSSGGDGRGPPSLDAPLYIDFRASDGDQTWEATLKTMDHLSTDSTEPPVRLLKDGTVVGLLTHKARVGDTIVSLNDPADYLVTPPIPCRALGLCLVIRELEDDERLFEIVGQAPLSPFSRLDEGKAFGRVSRLAYQLCFHERDLMVFVGQGTGRAESGREQHEISPSALLRRLETAVTETSFSSYVLANSAPTSEFVLRNGWSVEGLDEDS
jgi:hypothetical protein